MNLAMICQMVTKLKICRNQQLHETFNKKKVFITENFQWGLTTLKFYLLELMGPTGPNSSSCGGPDVPRFQGLAALAIIS